MSLSKIELLKKAFHNMKSFFSEHDMSCFFFNHSLQIFSTCSNDSFFPHSFSNKYDLEQKDLYQEIDNVKCQNITDFYMILNGIEILNQQKDVDSIKIIISDGFHTEHSKPIENIQHNLYKKFDYAIGLGNHDYDFDKKFLEYIGKLYHFHCVSDNFEFDFLDDSSNQKYIYIPPDSRIFTMEKFHLKNIEENEIVYTNLEQNIIDSGLYFNTFQYEYNPPKIQKKKHFIFFIDISGSMDNRILQSSILSDYYKNCNFFLQQTPSMWQKIPIYATKSITLLKDTNIPFLTQEQETAFDCMIRIIFHLTNMNSYPSFKKIKQMKEYEHEVLQLDNTKFKKYFQKQYHQILTDAEKKYIRLSNTFPTISVNIHEPTSTIENCSNNCIICYENKKTQLFSCLHFVCCHDCSIELMESKIIPECPLCRKAILWIGTCHYQTTKCIHCHENGTSIFSYPSGHVTTCHACCKKLTTFKNASTGEINIPFFST